jgi:hypothetical protein
MTANSSTSDQYNVSNTQHPGDTSFAGGTNNHEQHSCWFLSVSCIDDIVQSFTITPDRSAFHPYQRPVHIMSQFDAGLGENYGDVDGAYQNDKSQQDLGGIEGDDERDDAESLTGAYYWPSIERTCSFDDWNMDDETPVVPPPIPPSVFRFEESDRRDFRRNSGFISKTSTGEALQVQPSESFDDLLSGRCNYAFIEQASSMRPALPSSDSYVFQPILDETSAAPTMSIISTDTLSLNLDTDEFANGQMSPECRAIPRLASYDDPGQEPAIVQIKIECPSKDSSSIQVPHSIPEIVLVPREAPKRERKTLLKSWKMVLRGGRKDNGLPKRTIKSNHRRATKGGLGEF